MMKMPPLLDYVQTSSARRKFWITKIVVFLIMSALVGAFYGWSSSRAFPKNKTFGFKYGVLHGALMPLALPNLLLGQDVEIFASNNSGRPYKIGFICGINLCGLAFFGPLFWRPRHVLTNQKKHERQM
jgi:hypothetical protein